MTRRKTIVFSLVIAVILFILEVFLIKNIAGIQDKKKVVYTNTKIAANTRITAEMLIVKEVPGNLAHKLSFSDISQAVGKKARTDLEDGEMLLSSKIGTYGSMDGLAVTTPGNRLCCLDLKGDQANGWCIAADQRVDILFVPDPGRVDKNSSMQPDGQSCIKLNSIRVAAIIDDKLKIIKDTDALKSPKYMMVEVTPEQAEMLAFAKGNGRIEIASIPMENDNKDGR